MNVTRLEHTDGRKVQLRGLELSCFRKDSLYVLLVAGAGVEPASGGYEPPEVPFLYPAIGPRILTLFLSEYKDSYEPSEVPFLYPRRARRKMNACGHFLRAKLEKALLTPLR